MSVSAAAVAGRPAAAQPGQDERAANWLVPLLVVVVGMFMVLLDTSIVNVAVPTIQSEFGASTDQVQWVATVYTLALGVVVPLSGWMGDRYGLGKVYIGSLLAFAAGSALCGLAWSLNSLIGFRVVQAIGGGLLAPITMAMVYRIVPRERIGSAMGIYGIGMIFAPAVGPTLGGYLVEYVNWRLIFYINVPVGLLGTFLALIALPRFATRPGQRFDLGGFITGGAGLFSLLLALSEGQSWGWASEGILLLLIVAAFSLTAFVVIELSVEHPMLDLRVFRHWTFTNSALLITVLSAGLFAGFFYVPLFLQEIQRLGAFQTGLTLMPVALVMGAVMPFAGRLYDRIGGKLPATVGIAITAYSTYLLHGITPQTSPQEITLWMCLRSLGMGVAMMPVMTGGLAVIPNEEIGRASAINNIIQRVSGSLGLSGLTAILTAREAQQLADRVSAVSPFAPGFPGAAQLLHRGATGVTVLYGALQQQAFTGALSDVFLLAAIASAIGVPLALLLPGRARAAVPAGAPVAVVADPPRETALAGVPMRAPAALGVAALLHAPNGEAGKRSGVRFPLPPSIEPLPELAADVVRLERLIERLQSGVIELRDSTRRGLLVTVGGRVEAAWLELPGRELSGIEAELALLAWDRGVLRVHTMPPVESRAISWLWTLPTLSELPVAWVRPAVALEQLLRLPGKVAVAIDQGPESAVMILDGGRLILRYSEHRAQLSEREFLELVSNSGRLTARWSGTSSEVYGVVRSPDETELPGVTVTATDAAGQVVASAVTGPDGSYRIPGLASGAYTLVADGYHPVETRARVVTGELAVVEVAVGAGGQEAGEVYGTVRSPGGTALPGATVTATDAGGQVVARAVSGRDGSYRLSGLASGAYTLVASGYHPVVRKAGVSPGELATVDVAVGAGER